MLPNKDINAAIVALRAWLRSQNIDSMNAVPILGHTMAICITELAAQNGADPYEGFEAAMMGVSNSVELLERRRHDPS